jgi:hypothetical protein
VRLLSRAIKIDYRKEPCGRLLNKVQKVEARFGRKRGASYIR